MKNNNMNIKKKKNNNNLIALSKNRFKNIHMIGIGGVGMCGIAIILLKLGYKVSGSDLLKNTMTKKLVKKGATIYFYHSAKNIQDSDLIVISSAISSNNIEIIAAKEKCIPILLRAEMIQQLMDKKTGIAISGTHGKTTTTSMIVDIYIDSGLDPTFINGGLVKSLNTCAQLGSSNNFIVEADESDASFLFLNPKIAIVTNIESDHINHYNGSIEKLTNTFLKFVNKIPSTGIAIICIDNKILHDILPQIKCNIITYGFHCNADIRIIKYQQHDFIGNFTLVRKKNSILDITLNIPGTHNALNAAAAVALSTYQGINDENIIKSLKKFQGTHRRLELIGMLKNKKNLVNYTSMIIDDYGHHPTELFETIKTIRTSWPDKKLIMIFQPHRYTRTHNLYYDFVNVLSRVDDLIILDVYSANEPIILGADSSSLCSDVNQLKKMKAIFVSDHKLILNFLIPKLDGNDIILIQGAGDIETIAKNLMDKKYIK